MEKASPQVHVSCAVKQHEAMQENFEEVLKTPPNPPPYPTTVATVAPYSKQYGGQYGDQNDVNRQSVGSSEVNAAVGQTPIQQVSSSPHQSLKMAVAAEVLPPWCEILHGLYIRERILKDVSGNCGIGQVHCEVAERTRTSQCTWPTLSLAYSDWTLHHALPPQYTHPPCACSDFQASVHNHIHSYVHVWMLLQMIIREAAPPPDNTCAIIHSCVVFWLFCWPIGIAAFCVARKSLITQDICMTQSVKQ